MVKKPSDGEYRNYKGPQNDLAANLWICSKNQKLCIATGYMDAEQTTIQWDKTSSNPPEYCIFHLKGFGPYSTDLKMISQSSTTPPEKLDLNANKVITFNLPCPQVNISYVSYPELPPVDPNMQPIPYNINDTRVYEISSEETYINFMISDFKSGTESKEVSFSRQLRSYSTFYYNFIKNIPCPSGYDCSDYKRDNATVWWCWENLDRRKLCYPIADINYGFTVTSSGLFINSSTSPSYGISFKFKCEDNQNLIFAKTFMVSSLGNPFNQIEVKYNIFCPKDIPEVVVVKKFTAGAVFIIVVWSFIVFGLCIGILINYVISTELEIPFSEFFSAVGYYIIDGWNKVTCAHSQNNEFVIDDVQPIQPVYSSI
ncbi:hypothetical protein TVAG_255730 [Trichomonas vaginalis G3]|uniref:Uncharacterized protein n=1 Tax=Trichomonas vaginalis (strain ATCC PRA-98 / G3) TaxID=412133 RepID=A2DYX0_TRIV3|nr:hypothetical protein TVAGG3_0869360 [Trichomonas vaginalis G3]EAY14381.1 hypothetical protein TVAG_255730 [Trichomonas vaginalis G3]KAI5501260.1 hypothetical protein TVAGG3_0869360 [Trichomonas vaginalis G3]|eukprot:XP_001326604.1 hypothetical protein [Trichomonas vaginalis G3]